MTLLAGPPTSGPQTSHPDAAGAQRAALTEELASIRRWQRLVQARLDLATDLLSPADALTALADTAGPTDGGPADAAAPADLGALVRGQACADGYDAVDDLRAVVSARRALAARAADVSQRLAAMGAGPVADRAHRRRCCPSV